MSIVHRLMEEFEKEKKLKRDSGFTTKKKRKVKKKKKNEKKKRKKGWDSTTQDLTKYKLSNLEQAKKKAKFQSKHRIHADKLVKKAKQIEAQKRKQRNEEKKSKLSKRWEKRLSKKSIKKRTKKVSETITHEEQETESREMVVGPNSEPSDTFRFAWSEPTENIGFLDEKLDRLQQDFLQFEHKVREKLQPPENHNDINENLHHANQCESENWREMYEQQLSLQNERISSLTSQINTMACQMQTLLQQVEMLQRQKTVEAPRASHKDLHMGLDSISAFDAPSVPSTSHRDLHNGSDFISRYSGPYRSITTTPHLSEYGVEHFLPTNRSTRSTDLLHRSFIPSDPILSYNSSDFEVDDELHKKLILSGENNNEAFSSTLTGRKFNESDVIITTL